MGNIIGLSVFHEGNLRTLAAYLAQPALKAAFNMAIFGSHPARGNTYCGSVGCAVGHGPYAGIDKMPEEVWGQYTQRVFGFLGEGLHDYRWYWCFGAEWAPVDNTPYGAATRILWLLEKGLPDRLFEQMYGMHPLCYAQTEIYATGNGLSLRDIKPAERFKTEEAKPASLHAFAIRQNNNPAVRMEPVRNTAFALAD